MKLAKKVLSVVLAVAIALGAFAVAASANGNPDTAEYQVKIWLTGSVGSVTWTSNSKVTIDESKAAESAPGATIEAQPGDTVFVRLYVTNNYYVGTFQTNLFYSSDLIDAAEIYQAQRSRAITAANLKKIHIWNEDHYWAGLQGTSYSAQNAWSLQSPDANVLVSENWPTDDAGNELFNQADWKWNRIMNLSTEGVGETSIWDDDTTHLIMMPVTIPEDAAAGSTYYVTIPEGLEQRSAKPGGSTRLTEIGIADGESEPCDIVDTNAQINHNMQYGDDNQYFDYSEATLTIVIPGETEPTIDYSTLEAKLTEAKAIDTTGKTASSAAGLEAAITAGQAMFDEQTASSQDDVTAMVQTIQDAIDALEDKADYAALTSAITRYEAITDSSIYTTDSWAAATTAYNAAKAVDTDLPVAQQATVTAAADALNDALDKLAANLDYSALAAKVAEVEGTDTSIYTDDTASAFTTALTAAKAMVEGATATSQDEINTMLADLTTAYGNLTEKDADYTALEAAKAKYVALTASEWTSTSYALATEAYNEALAVPAGLKISAQGTIDAAAKALEDAITALVPATGADYSKLNAAIADYESRTAAHYTTDTWAAATTAYTAAKNVPTDLTSEDQATIDEAEAALTTALGALVEADADYTAVNTAKTAAAAKVAEADEGTLRYADEWIAEVNAAVAAVVEGLKVKDQATVDGYAEAINALLDAPVYRPYDYTAINEHIAAIEANPVDYYNADSYAAYLAKKEALVWDYTHEQYAKAKLQQIQFLKVTVEAAAAADYSDVEAAIEEYEAKKAAATYTDDSIAAVDAVIATVDYSLNENYQAQVDAYAAAIREATAKMEEVVVEYADYTALIDAIAAAANYAAEDYTAASYKALADAVTAGNAVDKNLLAAEQAIVDDAAKAITDAIAALKAKADYTALEEALAAAEAVDANLWTADSYKAVTDAVAAAGEVDTDLSADDQAIIDAAAKAITDAIAALEAKEVVSSITKVTYEQSEDTHNTFDVTVNGRMAMIQFIEEDGGTRTYDRYNKNVTIVSYNAAGEVVNSLDRSVAYEVWTINTNLIGPDVKARAKYLSGTSYIWETETYNFTVELLEPVVDAAVRSITPAATSGKKGAVSTVVVTGPDAQGVRFVMDNGTTTTYSADKAVALENGDLEFTGNAWMNNDGANTVKVQVKIAGVWTDAGTVEYTVE